MKPKQETFARQNQFNRDQYDRFSLMLPKGLKADLQAIAKADGKSLNAFINEAIQAYIQDKV